MENTIRTERGRKISAKTKGRTRTEEQRQRIKDGVNAYFANETAEQREQRRQKQQLSFAIRSQLFQRYKELHKQTI